MSGVSPVIISKGVLPFEYLDKLDVIFPISQMYSTPKSHNLSGAFTLSWIRYHFLFTSRMNPSAGFSFGRRGAETCALISFVRIIFWNVVCLVASAISFREFPGTGCKVDKMRAKIASKISFQKRNYRGSHRWPHFEMFSYWGVPGSPNLGSSIKGTSSPKEWGSPPRKWPGSVWRILG